MRQHISGESKIRLWKNPDEIGAGYCKSHRKLGKSIKSIHPWPIPANETMAFGLGGWPAHWKSLGLLHYYQLPEIPQETNAW